MLPDWSVLWVVFFVLVLAVVLDRLVFRPVLSVIKQREEAVTSARALAERAADEARRASEEFDRKTQEARSDMYRQMDEMRRAALDERTALIDETRREADVALAGAKADLARDVAAARASLEHDAESLSAAAAERILGRRAS